MKSFEIERHLLQLLEHEKVAVEEDSALTSIDRTKTGQDRGSVVLTLISGSVGGICAALASLATIPIEDADEGYDFINVGIDNQRLMFCRYFYRGEWSEIVDCHCSLASPIQCAADGIDDAKPSVAAELLTRLAQTAEFSELPLREGQIEIGPR